MSFPVQRFCTMMRTARLSVIVGIVFLGANYASASEMKIFRPWVLCNVFSKVACLAHSVSGMTYGIASTRDAMIVISAPSVKDWMVQFRVATWGHDYEVLNPIIGFGTVNVMDSLVRFKHPTEVTHHYITVFKNCSVGSSVGVFESNIQENVSCLEDFSISRDLFWHYYQSNLFADRSQQRTLYGS